MHMKDIFDMLAGTSTGGILSAALALPSDKLNPVPYKGKHLPLPKFWAGDCVQIYTKGGPDIFRQNGLSTFMEWLFYIFIVLLFTSTFYCYGKCKYDKKSTYKSF